MRNLQAKMVVAFAVLGLQCAQAAVPLPSQAELDKSPIIFTGTVTSREASQWFVQYCTVATLAASTEAAPKNKAKLTFFDFDNTNAGIRCLLERRVTLTLRVKDTNGLKQLYGVIDTWVTNTPNPSLESKVPVPPEPVGGNGGTLGIGAEVGDVLKIYESTNGQPTFGGIQFIKRAHP